MSTQTAPKPREDFKVVGRAPLWDGAAYWGIIAGVYLMVGGLMFYSGKSKLFDDDGKAPAGITEQFQSSFLHVFPGTDAAWVILGLLEFGAFLILLASLARGEFLPHRRKALLQLGLAVAMVAYACMSFGQTVTGQHEGTASLYQYFAATAVILILVSRLPPNRSDRWLDGG